MKSYKNNKTTKRGLKVNNSLEGETIEKKVERITTLKEPIKDGAPLIYTERKDGVQAGYNIKTDRFEVAIDAMDKVAKTKIAQRESRLKIVGKEESTESSQDKGTEAVN